MNLKRLFPYSANVKDVSNLIITMLIYFIVIVVSSILFGLIGNLWLIGWLFNLINWLIRAYCGAGAIVAVLVFLKVI